MGVPVKERGARTNEALEVIDRLLTEDRVSFEGRFTTLSGITIAPRSKQRPPFWVSGRKEGAMRRAAPSTSKTATWRRFAGMSPGWST